MQIDQCGSLFLFFFSILFFSTFILPYLWCLSNFPSLTTLSRFYLASIAVIHNSLKTTLLESPSFFLPIHLLFWYPSNCLFTLLLPLFLSSTDNCNFNDFWKVISVEHEISWLSSNDRSLEGTFLELVFCLFSSISFDLFRLQTQICPRKKKLRLLVLSF